MIYAYVFAAILVAMLAIGAWTLWFGRRAIRDHRDQVREIVEEARRLQAEGKGPAKDTGSTAVDGPSRDEEPGGEPRA